MSDVPCLKGYFWMILIVQRNFEHYLLPIWWDSHDHYQKSLSIPSAQHTPTIRFRTGGQCPLALLALHSGGAVALARRCGVVYSPEIPQESADNCLLQMHCAVDVCWGPRRWQYENCTTLHVLCFVCCRDSPGYETRDALIDNIRGVVFLLSMDWAVIMK